MTIKEMWSTQTETQKTVILLQFGATVSNLVLLLVIVYFSIVK